MNELDEFEKELAAMRPPEPSWQLRERIAARLVESAAPSGMPGRNTRRLRWAMLGGALAASVAAGALWLASKEQGAQPTVALNETRWVLIFDESLPSVWSFRSAARASESIDDLLDRHAVDNRSPRGLTGHVAAFMPLGRSMALFDVEL
jgi:hypothetical protein